MPIIGKKPELVEKIPDIDKPKLVIPGKGLVTEDEAKKIVDEQEKEVEVVTEEASTKSIFTVKYGDNLYKATESDGFPNTPIPGCFIKTDNGMFITEMTVLRGEKFVKDDKGVLNQVGEDTFQIIFYNNEGQRGYCGYKDIIKLKNNRTIAFKQLKATTIFDEFPPTLMTKDAGERFINGENVEISAVYPKLKTKQKRFVVLDWDPRLYDLISCWTVASYYFEIINALAILGFSGSNDMGKTKAQKTVIYASHKGLWWDDPTKAAAVRLAGDILQATEGVDEYQDLEDNLKGYARSVYKTGARSPRVEESKAGLIVKMFSKAHPYSIATKEEVEYGTFTRTIFVKMQKGDPIEDRDPIEYDFEPIRDDLYIARLTQVDKVYETFQSLKKEDFGMKWRDWEIWHGILTIAKLVSPEVFQSVKSLAIDMCLTKKQQEYGEERTALEAIEDLGLPEVGTGILIPTISFLTKDLTVKIWQLHKNEYSKDKWEEDYEFTKTYGPRHLGQILSRMKVKLKLVTKGSERTITRAEFDRMAQDYGYQH